MVLSYSFIEQLFFLSVAGLLLFLPGFALVLWLPADGRDALERTADALGISISFFAIIAMLTFFAGWHFNPSSIYLFFGFCFIAVAAALLSGRVRITRKNLLLFALVVLAAVAMISWRLYQARTLVFPAWVDSVHHVLIVQKILDNAGLPQTLGPELAVPFNYHYGFHITAALFSFISGLEPIKAVLWLGQLINALVALGIYRLAKSLWQNKRTALIAGLLVTFAFQMPAYYLTWGRYTLLTGLLVLLPAMSAVTDLLLHGKGCEAALRLALMTAALALVHYMALLFLGLFMGCILIERLFVVLLKFGSLEGKQLWRTWRWSVIAALAGLLVASPWLIRMLSSHQAVTSIAINLPTKDSFINSFNYILYLMGPLHNYILLGIAAIGLILVWFQKNVRGLAAWISLMVILSLPWGLNLGPFRPDHFAIVLFIPASLLLANGLVWVFDGLGHRLKKPTLFNAALAVVVTAGLFWGAWKTADILNPVTVLADQSDLAAIDWIKENIPPDARFLANTAAWQFASYRGVDGAYWITPLTRRYSVAMPALYGYAAPVQRTLWVDWIERASKLSACDEAFWSLVNEANLDYLYLHAGKGALQPEQVQQCTGIWPLYNQDGVWIYRIN